MDSTPPNGRGNESGTPKPDTATNTPTPPTPRPLNLPKLPSLRESIQECVTATNQILSSLETKYQESIRQPMTRTVHQISDTTTTLTHQWWDPVMQQQLRSVYGPYMVIGTSCLAGGIATVRRGRVSGLFTTVLVGGLSYGIIYGLDDDGNQDNDPFAKKNDWSKVLPSSITDLWKTK